MGRFALRCLGAVAVGFVIGLGAVWAAIVRDPEAFVEEDPYGAGLYGRT